MARWGPVRTETDDELMLAVRDERLDAMGVLFERHQQRMYRFFRRSVPDPASCEDLVQSLFVRMLEYRASYRGGASYLGWMYRIAINVRNDWLRRHRHEKASYVLEPNDEASPVIGESSAGEHARLRAAFDALRPSERDVLLLTRFEGLPYEEAAEVLNCSVGALKVRVHRALQTLRERYAERAGAPWD